MVKGSHEADPRGLIEQAYQIDGIGPEDCRTIFLDWALGLPDGSDAKEAIRDLLRAFGQDGHPMNAVLQEGLSETRPKRERRRSRG